MPDTENQAPAGAARTGGAGQSLAQHLGDVIDVLTDFRNTVDSPKRQNLLNALRQVQAEASAKGTPMGATVQATATAIAGLPSAGKLAESIGVREIPGFGAYEALARARMKKRVADLLSPLPEVYHSRDGRVRLYDISCLLQPEQKECQGWVPHLLFPRTNAASWLARRV